MKQLKPTKLKKFVSLTGDTSSIESLVIGNQLNEKARNIILSKIENNEKYLNGYFLFMDDGIYYAIKPLYEFYKFDSFNELCGYVVDKYQKYKSNKSSMDMSEATQKRILKRIEGFFEGNGTDFISYMNFFVRGGYDFSGMGSPNLLPNIFDFPYKFYKKSKIKKHKVDDEIYAPFSFKGYDFSFQKDYEELYMRYISDDSKIRYENLRVHTDGTIKELFELFYDENPDIISSVYLIYNYFGK